MHSYPGKTYIWATKGPPEAAHNFLKRANERPKSPQGPKRELSEAPQKSKKAPQGPMKAPRSTKKAPKAQKAIFVLT